MKIVLKLFLVYMLAASMITLRTAGGSTDGKNVNEHLNQSYNISYNIRVIFDHIFISEKNDSLEVSEIVVFRNEGSEIYYSRDNHTFFAISTPPEMKNLKAQAMECCLAEEKEMVLIDPMQPIAPGDNFEMQISYMLFLEGKEYVFNKSSIYNTTSLSIFFDKETGISIDGTYETLTLQGNEYKVVTFEGIRAGERISVPIRITEDSGYLYAGIGLSFLFSIGLVYIFRDKLFKLRKKCTLEELELEKKRIFHTIHGLEKHAGAEKSGEYDKLMEEYRRKVIRIFIEIDKIKNKKVYK